MLRVAKEGAAMAKTDGRDTEAAAAPPSALPVIATFQIRRRGTLSASGEISGPLPSFAADPKALIKLYRGMVLLRSVDAKAEQDRPDWCDSPR